MDIEWLEKGTDGQTLLDSLTAFLSAFARRHWKVTLNLSCFFRPLARMK